MIKPCVPSQVAYRVCPDSVSSESVWCQVLDILWI